ncbi:alanine racemase [Nocardioides gansuensis]|uniref:alanine racemase n=1 Tax=Nocardioides gansuensis TaxID=2138300 RepID=UPI001FEA0975|nr:alanine racemase [Nocardioides gansuensis]
MTTPRLVVEEELLRRNIDRVAVGARVAGVALRPHVKTHKCLEIARLQVAAGATGVTVATVGEAEVFVHAGFDDVLVAYPLWLDDDRATRLARLAGRARNAIGVDCTESAARARAMLPDVELMVEIDSGHHRTGCAPGDVGEVAAAGGVRGAFTFPGHSYSPDGGSGAAADEARALAEAGKALVAAGVEAPVLSGGSTPSLAHTDTGVVTELRPGVYVLGDAQQWELGSCSPDDIALTCHATVVSLAGGRVVVDAGSKVLGADRAAYSTGFGRLLDHPDARIVMLSEHHAVIEMAERPPLGTTLRLVPNHVCNAVNLADELWVGDQRWSVAARGRNG